MTQTTGLSLPDWVWCRRARMPQLVHSITGLRYGDAPALTQTGALDMNGRREGTDNGGSGCKDGKEKSWRR